jgi:uncharacterized protein YkwD
LETQPQGEVKRKGARAHLFAFAAIFSTILLATAALGVVLTGPLQSSIEGQTVQVEPSASPTAPAPLPEPSPEVAAGDIFTAPPITIEPPPPPPPPAVHHSTPAMLAFVNAQRAAAGLNPLTWSTSLANLAQGWSNSMAASDVECHPGDAMAHGSRPPSPGGQNVATNYMATPDGCAVYGSLSWSGSLNIADSGWMASPDHRANILDPRWTRMGGGGTQSPYGVWYWTQDFG